MWNNIKMDDGDWYNLDLTWDDANDQAISYDYFLIGSQTVVDGQAFSRQPDHVEGEPLAGKFRFKPCELWISGEEPEGLPAGGGGMTPCASPRCEAQRLVL